jgi:hypothetical protein
VLQPEFFNELEDNMKKVRDRLVKTEFLILGDWGARFSDLKVNSHTYRTAFI